jgi:hypothetical protein
MAHFIAVWMCTFSALLCTALFFDPTFKRNRKVYTIGMAICYPLLIMNLYFMK